MMERKSEKITRIVYVIAVVAAIAITVIYYSNNLCLSSLLPVASS